MKLSKSPEHYITLHINPFCGVKSRYRQTERHGEDNTEFLQLFVVSMTKTGCFELTEKLVAIVICQKKI
jgi:hypothetical protein